jgi:UDP-GlcNAc3NAcA epimerase
VTKILTIIGARPQFIKSSVVSKTIMASDKLSEVIVHTGQHFDHNMSALFFDELGIPEPDYRLDINGGSHGEMTGRMMIKIEEVALQEKPDMVLVYGDTNSTLAGALVASKLHIPVAHVEAGLRSFNMKMPEEVNRILTDQVSSILFCPTQTAIDNLENEGFAHKPSRIELVGDVMQDSAIMFSKLVDGRNNASLDEKDYVLATFHRAENTDDIVRLKGIVEALNEIHDSVAQVVVPLHPRTKAAIKRSGLTLNVKVIEPVGYIEMIGLVQKCNLVLTDSGGLQKEAFFFGKPCLTMRDQTEWTELVACGANKLVGAEKQLIIASAKDVTGTSVEDPNNLYGGGHAAQNIIKILEQCEVE